jgi:hypothetical protein
MSAADTPNRRAASTDSPAAARFAGTYVGEGTSRLMAAFQPSRTAEATSSGRALGPAPMTEATCPG